QGIYLEGRCQVDLAGRLLRPSRGHRGRLARSLHRGRPLGDAFQDRQLAVRVPLEDDVDAVGLDPPYHQLPQEEIRGRDVSPAVLGVEVRLPALLWRDGEVPQLRVAAVERKLEAVIRAEEAISIGSLAK